MSTTTVTRTDALAALTDWARQTLAGAPVDLPGEDAIYQDGPAFADNGTHEHVVAPLVYCYRDQVYAMYAWSETNPAEPVEVELAEAGLDAAEVAQLRALVAV